MEELTEVDEGDKITLAVEARNVNGRDDLNDEKLTVNGAVVARDRDSRKNLNTVRVDTDDGEVLVRWHSNQYATDERRGQAIFGRVGESEVWVSGLSNGLMDDRKFIVIGVS